MLLIKLPFSKIFPCIIIFTLVLKAEVNYAQEDSVKFRRFTFIEEIIFLNADLSRTNSEISALGYPRIPNTLVGIAFGNYLHPTSKDSYLSTKVGFYSSEQPDQFQTKSSALRRVESQMQWHFDLIKSRAWLVYPYVGFGFGFSRLYLADGINQSFSTSLRNPPIERRRYSKQDVFGSSGVGIERRFRFDFGLDMYFGLVAGYRFSQNLDLQTSSFPAYFRGVDTSFRIRMERWKNITLKKRESFKRFQ